MVSQVAATIAINIRGTMAIISMAIVPRIANTMFIVMNACVALWLLENKPNIGML